MAEITPKMVKNELLKILENKKMNHGKIIPASGELSIAAKDAPAPQDNSLKVAPVQIRTRPENKIFGDRKICNRGRTVDDDNYPTAQCMVEITPQAVAEELKKILKI